MCFCIRPRKADETGSRSDPFDHPDNAKGIMEGILNSDKIERMKELKEVLNRASEAYYAQDKEIMSNFEYDALYDELTLLEEQTGIVLEGSPTVSVGYEAAKQLPKERHESPMLSLAKTKSRDELADWLGDHEGLLSWKLDGLTIVLTYEGGVLQKAVTRGNGEIGEVITENARTFVNLPKQIPYQGKLVLRGEAVIPYSVFEAINETLGDAEAKYKNPRNLCSGSVRQLSSAITAQRKVHFYAFSHVSGGEGDFGNDRENKYLFLKEQGFEVVEYVRVSKDTVKDKIEYFAEKIKDYDIPSDGLVLTLCELEYAASLGRTAKFPRDSIAFKWADETAETTLLDIEWSPSRTGLINPVAIFEPVELEGTTVSRASVHNVSIVKELKLGIGDRITVYKANMIIPQIAQNLTESGSIKIPDTCPRCGGKALVMNLADIGSYTDGNAYEASLIEASAVTDEDQAPGLEDADDSARVLYCTNPDCPAKAVMGYSQFVSRDAMNIEGLSEKTIEKFTDAGFLRPREFSDIYRLAGYRDQITKMEGFGEKSFDNLMAGIEASRNTTLSRVINALGIAGIGAANAKLLAAFFNDDIDALRAADEEQLSAIDKIGTVLAKSITDYFRDPENCARLERLINELNIQKTERKTGDMSEKINGKIFCVTGSVEHFKNRDELKAVIEENGGKVTGSVSSKTDYLINNDITSMSGKNKKAKELGVEIINEETFLEMLG